MQMIMNLGLLRGYVGRDKTGHADPRTFVRAGRCGVGAYSTVFLGCRSMPRMPALAEHYGFEIPDWAGITTTQMIDAAHAGELDLFYCLGGNFLRNLPEPDFVAKALSNVPLRVHQDIILTDQMFVEPGEEGVLLLPAKTRYEQDEGGIETTTERRIAFTPEIPRQVGEARAEWKILSRSPVPPGRRGRKAGLRRCSGRFGRKCTGGSFYDGVQHLEKTHDAVRYGGPHLCADSKLPPPMARAISCRLTCRR